jgi:sugar fermentation stimulation protein
MQFKQKLQPGILIKRYKRFLADIELTDKKALTVHCPNTGSMLGCSEPGSPVMISRSYNPGRKYPHTLELVQAGSVWVGVNTSRTNKLVREALEEKVVKEFGRNISRHPVGFSIGKRRYTDLYGSKKLLFGRKPGRNVSRCGNRARH